MIKRVDENGNVRLITNIRKPRKWRRYEYLQSSGTQYIDTGVNGYMNHRYELDYQLTGTGSYRMWGVFGQATWQGYNMSITYSLGRSVRWSSTSNGETLVDNIDTISNTTRHTFIIDKGQIYYDGVNKGKSTGHSDSCIINYPIYLFTVNPANTTPTANAVARVYSYKDYDVSGNLVRHMVPAQYNGQYGMWDLVEDRFYPNKGTGTFTVGPEMKNYDEIYEVRKTTSLLPSGVELYDYILSSGTLYIDTGVIANQDISTELKAQYTNINYNGTSLWPALIGAADNNTKRFCIRALDAKKIQGVFGSTSYGTATVDTSIHTYKLSKTLFVIDSTSISVTSSTFSSYSMYLFTENHLNNVGYESRMSSAKMYYCKIWNGTTLVRNFLPCTYLGEPGMWDTVENKFYRNQGTGLFTLGSKITLKEYEYLQSSGTLYINTGLIDNTTNLEFEMSYKSSGSYVDARAMLLGGVWTSNNLKMAVLNVHYYKDNNSTYETSITPSTSSYDLLEYKNKNYIINNVQRISNVTNVATNNALLLLSDTQVSRPAKGYLKYTKIWLNSQLVRDFIPVSYNGTPGLWDKVEWKFYANAGSGSFTLGPEKASGVYPVSYLYDRNVYEEPDGSKWLRIVHHNNPSTRRFTSSDSFSTYIHTSNDLFFDASWCNTFTLWELMVKQKATSGATEQKFRWVLNYNPMTATFANVAKANVTYNTSSGYTVPGGNWGGLMKINNNNTYLCGNNGTNGNWWGAIGCKVLYSGGLPGWNLLTVTTGYIDLYIRVA